MIRIIAGRWRGRTLQTPDGRATRPTLGRVRQALFDLLGQDCTGRVVLDLFAGCGAIGLEALSRGAERAVFVEQAPPALAALGENIAAFGAASWCEVVAADAFRAGTRLRAMGPFDIVVADPPYGETAPPRAARRGQTEWDPRAATRPKALDERLRALLAEVCADSPMATVVLQADEHSEPPGAPPLRRTATYGSTSLHFLDAEALLASA